MRITYQDIKDLEPCYDPVKYIPKTWEGTLQDVLDLQDVPVNDRLWVVLLCISEDKDADFGRWCALQVADMWDCPPLVLEYLKTGEGQTSALLMATNSEDRGLMACKSAINAARVTPFTPFCASYAARAYDSAYADREEMERQQIEYLRGLV